MRVAGEIGADMPQPIDHLFPRLTLVALLIFLLGLSVSHGAEPQATATTAVLGRLDSDIYPLLKTWCLECHDASVAKADLNLELLDPANVTIPGAGLGSPDPPPPPESGLTSASGTRCASRSAPS